MPLVKDLDAGGEDKVPMVIGLNLETEIYNPSADEWNPYRDAPFRNWYSLGCFLQYNDKIYSLRDSVVELDPSDWSYDTLMEEIPLNFARSGRCASVEIDGKPGIMLRNGYWYSINDNKFMQKASPPYSIVDSTTPNSLWTWRGVPTLFGSSRCDETGEYCKDDLVIQYDPELDDWVPHGEMLEPRQFHEVIEVPAEFCDAYFPEPVATTPDPNGSGAVKVSATLMLAMAVLLKLA